MEGGRGGHVLERVTSVRQFLGPIFKKFLSALGSGFKFLSVLGHNFFICLL